MKNKEIVTKQDISWHIIDIFLSEIKKSNVYYDDKEFNTLVNSVIKHVNKKLELPTDGEITDCYVLVVQQPTNT